MSVYHIIEPDNFAKWGVTTEPDIPDEISFIDGTPLANLPSPLVFEVDYPANERPPHLLGTTIPVVSDYFLQALRGTGVDNFQAFPAVLRNLATGAEWKDFWALNVLGMVEAADRGASKYDTLMDGDSEGVNTPLLAFNTLVLDKARTRDLPMFRLAESPGTLLLHDRVLQRLIAKTPPGGWGFDATEVDVL